MNEETREQLFEALESGEISGGSYDRLMDNLAEDPEARRSYLDWLILSDVLRTESTARHAEGDLPALTGPSRRRSAAVSLVTSMAALLMIGLLLNWFVFTEAPVVITRQPSVSAAYKLYRSGPHGWIEAPDPGTLEIAPGTRVEVTYGTLELRISNGTRMFAVAPSNVFMTSTESCRLMDGSLWVEPGEEAGGFTVDTETFRVVDVGTKFGVTAGSGKPAEVHVEEGLVEVIRKRDDKSLARIAAGEAVEIPFAFPARPIPFDASGFARELEETGGGGLHARVVTGVLRPFEGVETLDLSGEFPLAASFFQIARTPPKDGRIEVSLGDVVFGDGRHTEGIQIIDGIESGGNVPDQLELKGLNPEETELMASILETQSYGAERLLGIGLDVVPKQKYKLQLLFWEGHGFGPGERIFDIEIDGRKVVDQLDIAAESSVEGGGPLVYTLVVSSPRPWLEIVLDGRDSAGGIQNPTIAALTLELVR